MNLGCRLFAFELSRPVGCDKRVDDLVEVAADYLVDLVERKPDAVIGDSRLRKIVGADALVSVACADLRPAFCRYRRRLRLALFIEQTAFQNLHRLVAVLELASLVLALHDHSRRQVSDADSGGRFVDVLTSGAAGAERVDFKVGRVDIKLDLLRFGQNSDGYRRGVYAPLAFGVGNALNAVNAAFKFETRICAAALHHEGDLAEAAKLRFAQVCDLGLPAFSNF